MPILVWDKYFTEKQYIQLNTYTKYHKHLVKKGLKKQYSEHRI
jgi:hypothetical protein